MRAAALPTRLLALALLLAPAPALAEETALLPTPGAKLALDYEVYKGGFHLLDIGMDLNLGQPGRYEAGLDAVLVGAPALIFSYRLDMKIAGERQGGVFTPNLFRQDVDNGRKKKKEWMELAFDARGVPQVTGDPLPAKEDRPTVTSERRRGALDPLSGVLDVVGKIAAQGDCNVEASVFDGRRRFDVVSQDAGMKTLPASSINIYSGPARLCELSVRPLAGYRFDGRDKKSLPRVIDVYMAPPAPGLPELPVRMVARSDWGAVLVHLVKVADPAKS
ncbi:MAG: hypothetical protein Kilf2KO_29050 [Rhodospirillales bacterium]